MRLRNLFFILLFLTGKFSFAQSLTGRWEGNLGNDEFLQINIIQTGEKACGYTWDYVYRDQRNYCKANFTGSYDSRDKTWFLNGTTFINNSGTHVLMQLKFKMYTGEGKPVLKGYCRATPTFFSNGGTVDGIRLEKVSEIPANITAEMKDCVKENNPPEPEVPLPPLPEKPKPIIADTAVLPKQIPPLPVSKKPTPSLQTKKVVPPVRTITLPKKPDTVKQIILQPVVIAGPKKIPLPTEFSGRKNKEIGHIIVHDKKITLNVYDNGTVDGDTVSIFYNGRLLISHRRLSEKPITLELTLDENTSLHSIVLFAENLGSIPPNTALVIFTTPSGKRYELFSSATLKQNAEIVFEYKPI